MTYKEIPLLTARDVELRVAQQFSDSVALLVYKDARVDMRILNECFGPMNWQRKHDVVNGNNYCTISIKNPETGEWVGKQDVGTPSKTEAEKGEASDSFKRAGFNWGIGVELYDAPDIKIKLDEKEFLVKNDGKKVLTTKFKVSYMQYNKELHQFDEFVVVDNKGKTRFDLKTKNEGQVNNSKAVYTQNKPQANVNPTPQPQPVKTQNNGGTGLVCASCGAVISEKVFNYSSEKFGKPLCMKCQKANG